MRKLSHRAAPCGRARRRSGEAGSAYLAVLLVLVILTMMGLSLATVTTLEMEVGSTERLVTRVFYGADSGMAVALAAALTSRDYRPRNLRFSAEVPGVSSPTRRAHRVELTHTVPILSDTCNLCSVNENELQFFKVNHAITAAATELRWPGSDPEPPDDASVQGLKIVGVMIEVQPWWSPPTESIDLTPEELAKIKF